MESRDIVVSQTHAQRRGEAGRDEASTLPINSCWYSGLLRRIMIAPDSPTLIPTLAEHERIEEGTLHRMKWKRAAAPEDIRDLVFLTD